MVARKVWIHRWQQEGEGWDQVIGVDGSLIGISAVFSLGGTTGL